MIEYMYISFLYIMYIINLKTFIWALEALGNAFVQFEGFNFRADNTTNKWLKVFVINKLIKIKFLKLTVEKCKKRGKCFGRAGIDVVREIRGWSIRASIFNRISGPKFCL